LLFLKFQTTRLIEKGNIDSIMKKIQLKQDFHLLWLISFFCFPTKFLYFFLGLQKFLFFKKLQFEKQF